MHHSLKSFQTEINSKNDQKAIFMLVGWRGRRKETGRHVRRRGGGEEMWYHASYLCASATLLSTNTARQLWLHLFYMGSTTKYLQHKVTWELHFQHRIFATQNNTQLIFFHVVSESCRDFYIDLRQVLSSTTKWHVQGAVTLWININNALFGNI